MLRTVAGLSAMLISLGAFPAAVLAFWDLPTDFDLDLNGGNDVKTLSDYIPDPVFYFEVKDWVWVPGTESFGMTKLQHKWEQSADNHTFAGPLPLPGTGKWSNYNYWYSYRVETHASFNLELDITHPGGPSNFTKTAPGHQPHPSVAALFGGLRSNYETGGSLGYADEPGVGETELVKVWSTATDQGGGVWKYEYWARNLTGTSADVSWTGYRLSEEGTVVGEDLYPAPGAQRIDLLTVGGGVAPGEHLMYELWGDAPWESHGNASSHLYSSEWIDGAFFAPMLLPESIVPEPGTLALAVVVACWGVRRRGG